MGSPKGMRAQAFSLVSSDQVHVSSSPQQSILQIRRTVSTEADATAVSLNVGVALTTSETLTSASELLRVAAAQVKPETANKASS